MVGRDEIPLCRHRASPGPPVSVEDPVAVSLTRLHWGCHPFSPNLPISPQTRSGPCPAWVDHGGGAAHKAPHTALALDPVSWLTPHGSRISQPASPLPYPVSILSISWLASAGNARGWAWLFGVLGCGDVQDGLLTGPVPLVPSLLPRGGEHGLLRGRRPALPQDRAPLLRPQLQLEQPHPLGHRLLQPDGRLRAGAPLPALGAGTALNPPPLPRPLPTAWGGVGRKGGKKKRGKDELLGGC